MARTKISEFSATPGDNTDIDGINIAEGCAPSGINNAIREMMSQLKDFQAGTQGDSFNGPHNGTVGATTPNTGAFTTLSSTGNTTLGNDAGDVITVNGATTFVNSNPILNAGTANGVAYLNGSKALTTGSALTFDGTKFGIGQSSPVDVFSVTGGNMTFQEATESGTRGLRWYAAGNERARISVDLSSDLMDIQTDGAAVRWLIGGESEQMRLTSTGLGIGTSSPAARLDVKGTANGAQAVFTNVSGRGLLISTAQVLGTDDAGSVLNARGASSGTMIFQTDGTERARIDSSGNLLVGTINSSDSAGIGTKVLTSAPGAYLSVVTSASTTGAHNALTYYSTGAGAFRFYVTAAGQIYATQTNIAAISDQTLKENIRDLETGLPEIMALKPRRFDWKNDDGKNVAGFIAQEVEQVLPELVLDYVYKKDEEGNNVVKKALKMGDVLPTLIKAIQELKTEFDAYKASHP